MWQKVYNFCADWVYILKNLWNLVLFINTIPILKCRVGQMLSSVFWNANTHLSEIFYFNIPESQTYSKYYHCQANIPNLFPWYIPPSASVQTFKPM